MQLDPLTEKAFARALSGPRCDEAHLLTVGLRRRRQAQCRGTCTHLALCELADRKEHPGELPDREHRQHVGLVLGRVVSTEQSWQSVRSVVRDAGVMPGRHRLESEPHGTVEKPAELQVPVALYAGIRRTPEGMRLGIRRDDPLLELLCKIEDVMVDPQPCRHAPRVVDVADRATS